MNKYYLACVGVLALAAASCAQGDGGSTGTAGTSQSGTAGTNGTAGTFGDTAGTSGNTAGTSGNTAGTSGNTAGTNGNTAGTTGNTAGTTGNTAGTTGQGGGGTTGQGGRGGTTGTGGGGTTGQAGRGGAGGGGTTGQGGRGGTTGTGGGGTTGAGGTTACPTIDTLVPGLDGYLWQTLPSGNTPLSGTNYPFADPNVANCPTNANWNLAGYSKQETPLAVKGTTGAKYTINIGVRGVVGTRCYTGGTPGSTAAGNGNGQNNTWYAGGQQYNNSIWNTMELRVAPKVAGQTNQTVNTGYDIYFTNSFQMTNSFCEKEATYETKFNASFPVMGGGSITMAVHDSNCRTIQNCGAVENQMSCNTAASRIIDMSGLTPAPVNFTQPRQGTANGATYQIQWVWIDVTSVTCN